jgi:ribonuclease-3
MILKKNIENFENKINFKFDNKENLIASLIHPSYIKEKKFTEFKLKSNFERLEFLGDRVLGLAISSLIFEKFKYFNEGDLTKKFSFLVQKEFLFKISQEIQIHEILKYSYKKENVAMNKSILSDAVESLIGAIYVDSGYMASYNFVKEIWGPYLFVEPSIYQDPKTHLQEISQKTNKLLPRYNLVQKNGPSHSPVFIISLEVLDLKIIEASGYSKKEAEKNAATIALKLINE